MYVNILIQIFWVVNKNLCLKRRNTILESNSFSLFGRFSLLIVVKFRSDISDMTKARQVFLQTNCANCFIIKIKSSNLRMKFHKYYIKTKWLKVCDLDSQESILLMVSYPNFLYRKWIWRISKYVFLGVDTQK